ncbi:MAG: helix-turn-helix domain-containing protein [Agriterribacter sp.]
MEKIVIKDGIKRVTLKRLAPQSMRDLLIPRSIVLSAEEWFGNLLYQVLRVAEGTVGYWVLDCEKDVSLTISRERPFCFLLTSLNQEVNCFFTGLGNVNLPAGCFNIIQLNVLDAVVYFRKGKRYRCMAMDIDIAKTAKLYKDLPSIDRFLTSPLGVSPTIYSVTPMGFNSQLNILVDALLAAGSKRHRPSSPDTISMTLYYIFKIAERGFGIDELLMHQLTQLHIIILHQTYHMPDIKAFAASINQSESGLRKLFKQVYGLPPYQYWQFYRMHYTVTRELLESNKKIKDIANDLGYGKGKGNFVRIFKHFCQLTPGQYKMVYQESSRSGKN